MVYKYVIEIESEDTEKQVEQELDWLLSRENGNEGHWIISVKKAEYAVLKGVENVPLL